MASVFLLSATPANDDRFPDFARDDLERMRRAAAADRFGVHTVSEKPDEADLILFVERAHATGPYQEFIRRHPLLRANREKAFVFNSRYYGIPMIPGIYGCVPTQDHFFKSRSRSGVYLEVHERHQFKFDPTPVERKYLYSFVGAVSSWPSVRQPILELNDPRGLVLDSSMARVEVEAGSESEEDSYVSRFVDISRASKFVLCPRGDAVSSMRLFESMRMGRPPVVISDGWHEPSGPAWDECSVRVKEKDIRQIPAILAERENEAEEMGRAALTAWNDYFAEDVVFHRTVESCLDMQKSRHLPESLLHGFAAVGLVRPFHARRYVRSRLALYRRHRKLFL